jgi:hypothetical protein
MDAPRPGVRRRSREELWFSISRSARQEQEEIRAQDQTALEATSTRAYSNRSVSPASIPSISTPVVINKPLPPPPDDEKKKRKPVSLRSLVRRRPSSDLDESSDGPTHLRPEPHQRQRSSSARPYLTLDPNQSHLSQSRSMPSSPYYSPHVKPRTHSAAANYSDSYNHQAYTPQYMPRPTRTQTSGSQFEAQPPQTRRTFPETPTSSTAAPQRQRPRTWLSPTDGGEAFHDPSEFHLFVQATTGLPDGSSFSPNSPPHLQGSLFPRGRQNDIIPIPLQSSVSARSSPRSHQDSSWQTAGYEYYAPPQPAAAPLVSSSALPSATPSPRSYPSPNVNAVNLELERLGLGDEEETNDDELPDYQQSQAEMNEMRRREAANRARELEARWNRARGR